ncbi:ATP-binding protein [Kitasatospora sp. NBC_01539]|uniref:ATP-binding protein n=1 Tax=Kitasatospora sp. NBC_01539 TaxID=2903577 RepID=UPI0038602F69
MMWIARFPGVPETVRAARRMARDALRPFPQADDAELIVSELATNAIVHSRSGAAGALWVELRWRRVTARIAVTDDGPLDGEPAYRSPEELTDFGRGLTIVDALADRWGASGEAGGRRTVWAELGPAAGPSAGPHRAWSGGRSAPPGVPGGPDGGDGPVLPRPRPAVPAGVLARDRSEDPSPGGRTGDGPRLPSGRGDAPVHRPGPSVRRCP